MRDLRTIFNEHNLRCTCQRMAVYETLADCRCHPTAEQLHQMVSDQCDISLSLATIYNTLEAFCQAGLAQRLPTPNGCCRYDATLENHLHVRYRESDAIEDVPSDLSQRFLDHIPREVLEEIAAKMGVSIDGVNIELVASRPGGTDCTS